METSVSFEARYAPSSYPTHGPTRLRGEDPVDPLLLGEMLRHLNRLERPAKQGTASCPPDDAVEGGEAPAGKEQNGRRVPQIGAPNAS